MDTIDVRAIRENLGLNQTEFWNRIGVTQSGGCRYEQGRRLPKPVFELLRLVHIEGIDLTKVTRADIQIIDFFKRNALMDVFLDFQQSQANQSIGFERLGPQMS